jgi:hypothetical protein
MDYGVRCFLKRFHTFFSPGSKHRTTLRFCTLIKMGLNCKGILLYISCWRSLKERCNFSADGYHKDIQHLSCHGHATYTTSKLSSCTAFASLVIQYRPHLGQVSSGLLQCSGQVLVLFHQVRSGTLFNLRGQITVYILMNTCTDLQI